MFVQKINFKESAAMNGARNEIEKVFAEMIANNASRCLITEVMVPRFEFFINYLGRKFFLPGAERQDVVQEALAGLAQAGATFDASKGASYFDFATMCMRNRVLAAVRKASRNKQKMLSECVTLDDVGRDPVTHLSPCRVVPAKLEVEDLMKWMSREMSDLEWKSLECWLEGSGVSELSERWEIEPKKIENALFRARRKAKAYLESRAANKLAA